MNTSNIISHLVSTKITNSFINDPIPYIFIKKYINKLNSISSKKFITVSNHHTFDGIIEKIYKTEDSDIHVGYVFVRYDSNITEYYYLLHNNIYIALGTDNNHPYIISDSFIYINNTEITEPTNPLSIELNDIITKFIIYITKYVK
ncbi:MAG: hypothetical protein Gaeavirus13_2 [Gaeavirus sp.]|uniref:Uncharacterized protein n=1 Tax=Gaeavirus sp. TaxID=2487767 RepID=A0A3G4ZZ77_9VIRU|nr:MAG: hypothetical protein Gaeavirus13_2 [Gaeavirus sp.]